MTNSKQAQTHKPRGLDWALIVSLVVLIGSAIFFMGQFSAKLNLTEERIKETNEKIEKIDDRLDGFIEEIKNAQENAKEDLKEIASLGNDPIVFMNGRLGSGLNMGVNTSGGFTNWVVVSNNISMKYPGQQSWGSVFITVGESTQPPRPARDYSKYSKILLEMKGEKGGETVLIGLKDKDDPDDGSESKLRLNLTNDWGVYELKIAENFVTANLKKLYVVTEFVFETKPQSIYVRKIQFIK